ncbi:MAG: hypothetical protein AAGF96_03990 [Bacteroidota bacterium]
MKYLYLSYLTILFAVTSYSQTESKIVELENQKKKFETEIKNLKDSINEIDLKIAQLKSKINSSTSAKTKEIERKPTNSPTSNSSSYRSSIKSNKSRSSSYNTKKYRSSRTYYRGPRGGCYYINSNGNKTYVARSLCN